MTGGNNPNIAMATSLSADNLTQATLRTLPIVTTWCSGNRHPAGVGVVSVRSPVFIRVKLLSCLLALLTCVQPAIALDCPCHCNRMAVCGPTDECLSGSCGGHDGCQFHEAHCGVSVNTDWALEVSLLTGIIGFRPCQCPSNCDCHLRHAAPRGTPHMPRPRVANQQPAADIAIAVPPNVVHEVRKGMAVQPLSASSGASSCAVLCRFTI